MARSDAAPRGAAAPRAPRSPRAKVTSLARLLPTLLRARRAGSRVVFTNGVFDLLHPGHVSLLRRARALGDLLVVAINSDASVRRLKGPGRPYLKLRQRALMLASLEAVDYVVSFAQDTPLRLIERLRPDILVKGGDWKAGAIVGEDLVKARGGRVVSLPLVTGLSTTRIIRAIRARRDRS